MGENAGREELQERREKSTVSEGARGLKICVPADFKLRSFACGKTPS